MDTQDPKLWGQYFESLLLIKAELLYSHVPLKRQLMVSRNVFCRAKRTSMATIPPPKPPPASPKEPLLTLLLPPWEGLILSPTHPKMLAGGALINGQY